MSKTTLKFFWSEKEQDFYCEYPRKCDGNLLFFALCDKEILSKTNNSLIKELENRGYDLKTIKFEIKKIKKDKKVS